LTIASQNSVAPRVTSAAEGYERWAPLYDDAPNPLLAREMRYLLPLLGDVRNKRTVDLACGTGRWLEKLATHGSGWCAGIDLSASMLGIASGKHPLAGKLIRGTCECLPFVPHVFDLAICSFALGHFASVERFAGEVSRVCKLGADVFVTDLHPSAVEQGWRVGFRDGGAATVEIEVAHRGTDKIVDAFSSQGLKLIEMQSLWLEQPELAVFVRAGRTERFASATQVPAILALHFRRLEVGTRGETALLAEEVL